MMKRLVIAAFQKFHNIKACFRQSGNSHRMVMMRIALNIPDDVYLMVRCYANANRVPLTKAVAVLLRNALAHEEHTGSIEEFPCFRVPDGAAPLTLEQTLSAEDGV